MKQYKFAQKFTFLLIVLSNITYAFGTDLKVDSLKKLITSKESKLEKGKTYFAIGDEYSKDYKNYLAIKYIDSSLTIFESLKNDTLLAKSYAKKGVAIIATNDIDLGISNILKSIAISKKINDSVLVASYYSYIAGLQSAYVRDYTKALIYQDSADTYLPNQNVKERIYGYVIKSSIYINIQEFKLSLDEANKGIKLSKQNNDVYLTHLLSNKGTALDYSKDYAQAIVFYKESLKYNKEEKYKAIVLYNLSQIFDAKGDLDSAIFYNQKALQIFKKSDNQNELNQTFIGMVEIYNKLKERDSSKYYLSKINEEELTVYEKIQVAGLKFTLDNTPQNAETAGDYLDEAMQNNYLDLAQTLSEKLYFYYKEQGDADKSLHFLEFNKIINDSVLSNQKIIDIQKAEAMQIIEAKNEALDQKEKSNIHLAKKINKQKVNLYILTITILTLLILLYSLFKRIKAKKDALRLQKNEIENQKNKRKISETNLNKAKELILKKNKLIKNLEEESYSRLDVQEASEALIKKINTQNEWAQYMTEFEMIYPNFIKQVIDRSVDGHLTKTEIRLLTLLKLNLSNKEISEILYIEHDSVKKAKQRLTKKFVLEANQKVSDFIISF